MKKILLSSVLGLIVLFTVTVGGFFLFTKNNEPKHALIFNFDAGLYENIYAHTEVTQKGSLTINKTVEAYAQSDIKELQESANSIETVETTYQLKISTEENSVIQTNTATEQTQEFSLNDYQKNTLLSRIDIRTLWEESDVAVREEDVFWTVTFENSEQLNTMYRKLFLSTFELEEEGTEFIYEAHPIITIYVDKETYLIRKITDRVEGTLTFNSRAPIPNPELVDILGLEESTQSIEISEYETEMSIETYELIPELKVPRNALELYVRIR